MDNPTLGRLRAAIVDLDGTLVDTLGDFCAALDRMLERLGHPPIDRAVVETFIGKGSEHLIRRTLAHAGLPPERFDDAWTWYQAAYAEVNGEHSALFPGAREGVEALRAAGLQLACLTNKPTVFARELLRRKGLGDYFLLVFGGDAFSRKKPDPLPVVKTCEALGLPPAACVMVGDSANDAAAARGAGCPVLLVTYGYNHGEPVRAGDADGFVDSLADAVVVLGRMAIIR